MSAMTFIGVDLGTSLKRRSTGLACIVEKRGRPCLEGLPLHIVSFDEAIRSSITLMSGKSNSSIIGIDAPLSRPEHGTMRDCEKRLRKHGIACYPSGANWVRQWVDKGIALKDWAQKDPGNCVVEVYPYAARRALGIGVHVKKKTKQGRRVVQDGLLSLLDGLEGTIGDKLLSDDELDAILSAYTAYCVGRDKAIKMDGSDGAIYLPLEIHNHEIDEY